MRASSRPRSEAIRARWTSSLEAISLLQGLDTRDFELFDHAPALQPGCFQRLLPRHFGGFDVATGDDLGLPDLAIGVDALGAFRRQRDDPLLVASSTARFWSILSTSRVLAEAMRSASSASSTPMRWRSMASRRFSSAGLDRFRALDILLPGFLLAQDARQGDLLFLGDSRRLDGFTGSDVGLLDRAVARDFERPDPFFLAMRVLSVASRAAMPATSSV